MTFNEYQALAKRTLSENPDSHFKQKTQTILAMGIVGEAGEVIEK